MRLRRFSVSGYKNLRQPVTLDGLGPINLIHGANNVGKSNLLQAMALFFRCLLPPADTLPFTHSEGLALSKVGEFVPDLRSLFHLEQPAPIVLNGLLDIPE